jgi:polyisoprenyl-teichoic acid--peptidoglycan teichoic acid transferase
MTRNAALALGIAVLVGAIGGCSPSPSPSTEAQAVATAGVMPTGSQAPTGAPTAASPSASPGASPSVSPSASAAPSESPLAPGADPLLGTDGRFTVLLLGSDYRPAHPGNRTDAIIVASVDPVTGKTAALSIPRDLLNFPLPNGKVWRTKVNALYQHLLATTKGADKAMRRAVGEALGVEIDGLVKIGFTGVLRMVAAIDGVTVDVERSYYDPYYWVNGHTQGWGISAGTHKLNPQNALIFARSRKGDNDYGRAARQQQLVVAAIQKVKKEGVGKLPELLRIAKDTVRTDLPRSEAKRIFEIVSKAKLDKANRVVLTPGRFGRVLGRYMWELKLDKVHKWIKNNFPPVTKGGTWPPASAVPSGSVAPAPAPSASGG